MLDLFHVSKKYDSGFILDDINLHFKNVGFYCIVGESGSGKSTLLNLIAGLLKPTQGKIVYQGQRIDDLIEEQSALLRQNDFIYIYQNENLIETMSVIDNISLILAISNLQVNTELLQTYLEQLDLQIDLQAKVDTLSGGEKQRIAILIAMLKDAKVILADEITSNLDPESASQIFKIFQNLAQEKLIIFVSHDHAKVAKYSDFIIDITNKSTFEIPKIIEEKDYSIQPVSYDKERIMNFEKKLHSKNTFDTITFSLLSCLFLVLSLVFSFIGNYNYSSKINSLYQKNFDTEAILTNYNFASGKDKYDFQYVPYKKDFSSFQKMAYVYHNPISIHNFTMNSSTSSSPLFGNYAFSFFVLLDSYQGHTLQDNEIIITDYTAELLENYGLIHLDDENTHFITYFQQKMKLIVKGTDFSQYKDESYYQKHQEEYRRKREYSYEKCYMNYATFFQFFPYLHYYIRNLTIQSTQYEPNSTLQDNQVILSYDFENVYENDYPISYFNYHHNFQIQYVSDNKDIFNTVFVSNKIYYTLAVEYIASRNENFFGLLIMDKITYNKVNDLYQKDFLLLNANQDIIQQLLIYHHNLKMYQIIFFVTTLIAICFFFFYFYLYKNKMKRDYHILSYYGCDKKLIFLANKHYFIKHFMRSLLIGNLLYFLLIIFYLRKFLSKVFHFSVNQITYFDPYLLIINCIFIFFVFIAYDMMNKKVGGRNDSTAKNS